MVWLEVRGLTQISPGDEIQPDYLPPSPYNSFTFASFELKRAINQGEEGVGGLIGKSEIQAKNKRMMPRSMCWPS